MNTNKLLDYKFNESIAWYDGPILSLGVTPDNMVVLQSWVDTDDEKSEHLYSYVFMKPENVLPFIHNQKSYYQVIQDCEAITMLNYNGEAYNFRDITTSDYLQEYGPDIDASLEIFMESFRPKFNEFLEKDHHFKNLLTEKHTKLKI